MPDSRVPALTRISDEELSDANEVPLVFMPRGRSLARTVPSPPKLKSSKLRDFFGPEIVTFKVNPRYLQSLSESE